MLPRKIFITWMEFVIANPQATEAESISHLATHDERITGRGAQWFQVIVNHLHGTGAISAATYPALRDHIVSLGTIEDAMVFLRKEGPELRQAHGFKLKDLKR